jgi:hypothetical protein
MRKIFFILIFIPITIFSQQKESLIDADRPDQTESPTISAFMRPQIELGYYYERTSEGTYFTETNMLYPAALLRLGVAEDAELRMYVNIRNLKFEQTGGVPGIASTTSTTGLMPIAFGTKLKVFKHKKLIPEISVLFDISVGSWASKVFKTDEVNPTLTMLFQNKFKQLSVTYNLGLAMTNQLENTFEFYTFNLSYSITKRLQIFGEVFGTYTKHGLPDNRFDGGLSFIIGKDIQIDAMGGKGIGEHLPVYFFSAGISFRLPKI